MMVNFKPSLPRSWDSLSASLLSPRIQSASALACGCGHPALYGIKTTSIEECASLWKFQETEDI
jgi:hypothetical protein